MVRQVCVELDCHRNKAIRIFRGFPKASDAGCHWTQMDRAEAVAAIRKQVFVRAKGMCDYCGGNLGQGGHMHEKKSRGRGGEISLANCVAICAGCHRSEHPGTGGAE